MVLETVKEIKERGIRNIVEENIELVKELGLLGAIKAKTEHMKEQVLGKAEKVRKTVIGEKIGKHSSYEIPEEYPPASEEIKSEEVGGRFKTGI